MELKKIKIAIVHDWLTGMRGGEKVLELLIGLYPDADIFTLLWIKGSVSPIIEKRRITTSFLQKMPWIKRYYRHYLPLYPLAIESFNLGGYDLVISSSHCVAKGALAPVRSKHVCYCYTPMRYIWDMYFQYFGRSRNWLAEFVYRTVAHRLRIWDITTNSRVDDFMAISKHVANRIKRYYGRTSTVIYPPADVGFYQPVPERPMAQTYYLVVSGLVPYKRIDLAIETFNQTDRKLVIIGEGPEKKRLMRMAKSNITFLGWASNDQLRQWYSHCSALIFPGEEDFGIVPVEVQACGRPVIAYSQGGATETVVDRLTGVFFHRQHREDLNQAILTHESLSYDKEEIIKNARRFSNEMFCAEFKKYTDHILAEDNICIPLNKVK